MQPVKSGGAPGAGAPLLPTPLIGVQANRLLEVGVGVKPIQKISQHSVTKFILFKVRIT